MLDSDALKAVTMSAGRQSLPLLYEKMRERTCYNLRTLLLCISAKGFVHEVPTCAARHGEADVQTTCVHHDNARKHIQSDITANSPGGDGSVRDFREFYSQQNVKTPRGYMTVWVELLRYIWRTADQAE